MTDNTNASVDRAQGARRATGALSTEAQTKIVLKLRALGSLIVTTGLAEHSIKEWHAIATVGEMIVELSELILSDYDNDTEF